MRQKLINYIKMCLRREVLFTIITVVLAVLAVSLSNKLLFVQENEASSLTKVGRGAVVANGIECSEIGAEILRKGGSAVDAAIATLFCDGVTCPQSTGLGGGFFMTIYIKDKGTVETLDAREVAPLASNETMFVGKPDAAKIGGLAVAVPGELKGYWEAHKKYGKLPWREIIQPIIELCKNGHKVSRYLAKVLRHRRDAIWDEPTLRHVFINPLTNHTWRQGDLLRRPTLAKTLETIANEGENALYSPDGSIIKSFVHDVQSIGGILTEKDLINYRVQWNKPEIAKILNNKLTLYTQGLPGTGTVLALILNILNGYQLDDGALSYHRLVESFKFGYASRTHLGDMNFVEGLEEIVRNLTNPSYADVIRSQIDDTQTYNDYEHYGADYGNTEDHGTAHISVLAPNGDAVSATGTINLIMGAMRRSPSTGIMLNDEMDDFSTPNTVNEFGIPASPANFIQPGKKPLSSMVPSIILNNDGTVKMVIGAAGGSKITTSVAYVIMQHLYLNHTLSDAMKKKRLHHQLAPMKIQYEENFDENFINQLKKYKHDVEMISSEAGFAAVTAISRNDDGTISASYDPRRGGSLTIID